MIPADVRKKVGALYRKHNDAFNAAPKGAAARIAGAGASALARVCAIFEAHDAAERRRAAPTPPLAGPTAAPVAQPALPRPEEVTADDTEARAAVRADRARIAALLRSALETGTMGDVIALLVQLEQAPGGAA